MARDAVLDAQRRDARPPRPHLPRAAGHRRRPGRPPGRGRPLARGQPDADQAAAPLDHPEGHRVARPPPRHCPVRRDPRRSPSCGRPARRAWSSRRSSGTPRLAWQVTSVGKRADQTPSRLSTFVDARTGKVLRREEHVVNVDGTGNSLYSGTVPLQVTQSGSTYQLKDGTRGNTYTTDMNNAPTRSCARTSATAARPGRRSPARRRRSATAPTATGPPPAWTRSTAPT